MKTEEKIREKILKLNGIIEAYKEGLISVAYIKISQIHTRINELKWVLEEIEEKSPELKKRISITSLTTTEEKVIKYLTKKSMGATNKEIRSDLGIEENNLCRVLRKLRHKGEVKIISGKGGKSDPYVYSLNKNGKRK